MVKSKKILFDLCLLTVLAFCTWFLYFLINYRGLVFPDAQHYASIARNIVRGDGYLVNLISPATFTCMGENVFNSSSNPLLLPYLLALFYKIGGVSGQISALSSGLFFVISVFPLYFLSGKLFGRLTAITASAIYIFEPTLLEFSISGLTEPVFIFFLLTAFLFLVFFIEDGKVYCGFLSGVFMGLCRLTRFNAGVFIVLVIVALFLFVKERRFKAIALFGLGIILVHIPEFVSTLSNNTRSLAMGLINYTAIDGTEQYPAFTITRIIDLPSSWEYITTFPKHFMGKYFHNMFFYFRHFFAMANPFIIALFTVNLMSLGSCRVSRIILIVLGLSIVTQAILLSYVVSVIRYLYIFIPFIIIFGVGYFFKQIYPIVASRARKVVAFLLVLLFLLPTTDLYNSCLRNYGLLFRGYKSKEAVMVEQQKAMGDFIKINTKKDDFIATDYTSIAWYADRKTLELPISFRVLETIDSKYKKVDALLVTSESDIKDISKLTGVAKQLVEWKAVLSDPPKELGKFILADRGEIKGERFVFYKKKES